MSQMNRRSTGCLGNSTSGCSRRSNTNRSNDRCSNSRIFKIIDRSGVESGDEDVMDLTPQRVTTSTNEEENGRRRGEREIAEESKIQRSRRRVRRRRPRSPLESPSMTLKKLRLDDCPDRTLNMPRIVLERNDDSVLVRTGRKAALDRAADDFIACSKCGGLIARDRLDAHLRTWCVALSSPPPLPPG